MKLEVVVVPVSDVDRAKRFYASLGFHEDIDYVGKCRLEISFSPSARDGNLHDALTYTANPLKPYWSKRNLFQQEASWQRQQKFQQNQ